MTTVLSALDCNTLIIVSIDPCLEKLLSLEIKSDLLLQKCQTIYLGTLMTIPSRSLPLSVACVRQGYKLRKVISRFHWLLPPMNLSVSPGISTFSFPHPTVSFRCLMSPGVSILCCSAQAAAKGLRSCSPR